MPRTGNVGVPGVPGVGQKAAQGHAKVDVGIHSRLELQVRIGEFQARFHGASPRVEMGVDVGDLSPEGLSRSSRDRHDGGLPLGYVRNLIFVNLNLCPYPAVIGHRVNIHIGSHVHVFKGVLLDHMPGRR